jgi:uncharacterized protein YerC
MAAPFVCDPTHKHGATGTCYQKHRCRCADCRAHRAKQERDREARARNGELQEFVNAIITVPRIMQLMREDWTYADIEAVSGVSVPTISRIMRGVTVRVERETADALLGTHPKMRHRAPEPRKTDATGTVRRIRALVAVGWTFWAISARAGHAKTWAYNITRSTVVTATTRDLIARLYDEMWNTLPPRDTAVEKQSYTRSRGIAVKNGWASPLAWDDDTIDDPDAEPELPTVEELWASTVDSAIAGEQPDLNPEQRREVITVLNERRWSGKKIADHIGCNVKTVERVRAELGLPIYLANSTHHRNGTLAA